MAEHVSIGLDYLKGDRSGAEGGYNRFFTHSPIDCSVLMISAEVDFPILIRNSLSLKVNTFQYDYNIIDDNKIVYNHDGSDLGCAFGWMYQFDNGLGSKTVFETLYFGQYITIKGINAGISYRF